MGIQQVKGRAVSIPGGLAIGAAVSMVVTIIIAAIGANLVMNQILPQENIGYCSLFALLAGGITGAITASAKVKHRKLVVCLLSGLVYYVILLSMTALFFGGQYEGMGVTLITIAIATVAAAMISSREGKQKKHRGYKKSRR